MPRSRRLYTGRHLDGNQVSSTLFPDSLSASGFDDSCKFRYFNSGSFLFVYLGTYLTSSWLAFSVTLTTMAFVHSSLRWFEASTCMATSEGHPPSLVKHSSCLLVRYHSLSWRTPCLVPELTLLNFSYFQKENMYVRYPEP